VLACAAAVGGVLAFAATTQAAVTLPPLAGHWGLNEGSGSTAVDSSGNGNNGTLGSGTTWTSGPDGGSAVAFNGTSSSNISIAKAVVNTSQSFTVSAWVKFNNVSGAQTFVSLDDTQLSAFFLQINSATGKLEFLRWATNSQTSASVAANSGVTPQVGTWYHVVGEDNVSTGQLQIYVNGTEDGTASYAGGWQGAGNTIIGRGRFSNVPADFVNGAVSDVQIYQAALSTTQVAALNSKPVSVTSAATGSGVATITDSNPVAGCTNATKCLAYVGDTLTDTAMPSSGSVWSSWSGGSCAGKTNPCSFTASATETDTANFKASATVTVVATAGPEGTATVSDTNPVTGCTGSLAKCVVPVGDTVTITAQPNSGYAVASWSGNAACAGTVTTCVLRNLQSGATIVVNFALSVAGTASSTFFVSPSGSDSNPGTQARPVQTPQHGLQLIEASRGALKQMRLAQGSYAGGLSLTSADDGVSIYGGFDPTSWAAVLNPSTPTMIAGAPQAVLASGATGILLQQLALSGQTVSDGSTTSVYGIRAIAGSKLSLLDVSVTAANALPGANGATGATGSTGGNGGNGRPGQTVAQVAAKCLASAGSSCMAVDGKGGTAGLGVNGNNTTVIQDPTFSRNPRLLAQSRSLPAPAAGPSAGDGGFGGWGSDAAPTDLQGCVGKGEFAACGPERVGHGKREVIGLYYGSLGSNSAGVSSPVLGGRGGASGNYNTAGDGYPGANGTAGAAGAGGAAGGNGTNPSTQGDSWATGVGGVGATGDPGAGGGGGGGGGGGVGNVALAGSAVVYGSANGGGGGGGGGAGGTGGAGGVGGGGSFGIYLNGASSVTVSDGSSIVAGNGGAGGNGGTGGTGGRGGKGGKGADNGVPRAGAGGSGGAGGAGGAGGPGGGGPGGPSASIFYADAASQQASQLATDTAVAPPRPAGSAGFVGAPGTTGGARARGGASGACHRGCGFSATIPVMFPAYAVVHGHRLTMEIACTVGCHGTGMLRQRVAAKAAAKHKKAGARGKVIASFHFTLRARGVKKLTVKLTAAGRKLLAGKKRLIVTATMHVVAAKARPQTYASAVAVTRRSPKALHLRGPRASARRLP
jgi:hypothetical protein